MAVQILGSMNVDIITAVDRLPKPGETVIARRVDRQPGGKGANQAIAAARMGAVTAMAAAVGADEGGAWMRATLAAAGVDTAAVRRHDGVDTGSAHIAVDAGGENQIIVAAGANVLVSAADVPVPGPEVRVLLAQLEVPVATIAAVFGRTTAQHCRRILNAAPALLEARGLFPSIDMLIVNEHELATYLGLAEAPIGPDGALAARALLAAHDQVVIVTLGAQGATAVWSDRHFHAPALPVVPVDTVGAGDCFCGVLAALLDEGRSVEQALPVANAAAALCTLGRGAGSSMPTRDAVTGFLAGRQ